MKTLNKRGWNIEGKANVLPGYLIFTKKQEVVRFRPADRQSSSAIDYPSTVCSSSSWNDAEPLLPATAPRSCVVLYSRFLSSKDGHQSTLIASTQHTLLFHRKRGLRVFFMIIFVCLVVRVDHQWWEPEQFGRFPWNNDIVCWLYCAILQPW